MFAVLFGLSMDYEVFLVARMRDAYLRTGDTATAIVHGLAGTARVTAAAAVLIDATVVRLLLVPAVMHVLGDRNWWLPGRLDRRLPRLSVEGHEDR